MTINNNDGVVLVKCFYFYVMTHQSVFCEKGLFINIYFCTLVLHRESSNVKPMGVSRTTDSVFNALFLMGYEHELQFSNNNHPYHFRLPGDIGPGFSRCSETIICIGESPVWAHMSHIQKQFFCD